jgi:PAS domain S-box-containing protein
LFLSFFIIYDFVVDFLVAHNYSLANAPVLIFWLSSLTSILLIKKTKLLTAKLLSTFLPPLITLSYIFLDNVTCGHFLWQPIALIGFAIVPVLVFDYKKEKTLLFISTIINLLYIIFYERILSMGVNSYHVNLYHELNTNPFIYKSVQLAIFSFLFTIIYYSIKINNHQQLINERIYKTLLRERDTYASLNAEMQAQRNAINESASLVITDEKGDIQFTNNNFCITTGYSNKELIGKNPRILNSGYHDDTFFRDLWKTIKSGKVWRGEIRNKRKDNSYYWLDTAIAPIFNRSNNQKGYLAIRFDCTKRKEYEEELEKLNKSNKNLIYSVAHDLKGPFMNFQSLLSLNNLCLLTKEEGEKIINQLIRDSNYSLKLLEELLMAGRMENPNYVLPKKKVNLNKFLKKLIRQFDEQAKNKHLIIKSDFQENIPSIEINEDKFNRAIRNLLSNALKFTPEKGQILMKTKLKSNNKILISISDSGIGIAKENQKYIFDRFTKYSKPGLNGEKSSGLGLWIVQRIIELHDGEISVKSEVNTGTTFTVILPVK